MRLVGTDLPGRPESVGGSRAELLARRRDAVAALERDAHLDWRRPLVGTAALVLLLGGQLVGAAVLVVEASDAQRWAVLAGSALAVAAGTVLGVRTWRAGRRVVDALVAWEELPDHVPLDGSVVAYADREPEDADGEDERRRLHQRNLVDFRTRQLRVTILPRVVAGTLLALVGLGVVLAVVDELVRTGTLTPDTAAVALPGLTALAAAVVVLGGLQRVGASMFRRDRRMRRRRRDAERAREEQQAQWRRQWRS